MAKLFSPPGMEKEKKILSPKRKRQLIGGVLIITWTVISVMESFKSIIEDISKSWVFILLSVVFCLSGGVFIFFSSKPDIPWEKEQEELKAAREKEIQMNTKDFSSLLRKNNESEEDLDDDPKKKFLE